MKRVGNLYEQIGEWDTLRAAFHKARRGARRARQACAFEARLDENLRSLQQELLDENVTLSGFTRFVIHDPKERIISAPAFRDRVLHHAIIHVCEPHLERWLIHDTWACRQGKGRLAALERATAFAKDHEWFVKMDVRKYFDSIPHRRLMQGLERKFKDRRLLHLIERIVRSHEVAPGRGLPIGSLTSQHLANFYLDPLDRFVKERLRISGYVRYMDDFLLWSPDRVQLVNAWREVERFLSANLGLELKAGSHLNRSAHGVDFCGFRIFPGWRVLNRRSRRRFAAKMREVNTIADERERQRRADALLAFAKEGNSWHFRSRELARATTA